MNYFIAGTDTGVGKTLVSCALLRSFAAQGWQVAGFKPVAAGGVAEGAPHSSGMPASPSLAGDAGGYNDDAKALRAASTIPLSYEQVNPYCFRAAIAPHIAAQQEQVRIELPRIVAVYNELAVKAEMVIVEGAGGFRVPLNDEQDGADLVRALNLPVILVVGMRLGCLNHALLTAEAILTRDLILAGWVANVLDANMPVLQENIAALRVRIAAPLLGVIPYLRVPEAAAVQLDIDLLDNVK